MRYVYGLELCPLQFLACCQSRRAMSDLVPRTLEFEPRFSMAEKRAYHAAESIYMGLLYPELELFEI